MRGPVMHISRLLLSLFTLSSLVCSAYAMEEKEKPQRDRKRDRISRAFKNFTIRPGGGESTPPEPTLHKSHSYEGPGAEESSGTGTIIIQPRAPQNSVDAVPPHLLMNARSQAGVPLVDKQSLTGSPPKEDDILYAPIELSETGQLTPTDRSPQAPRHMSPEEANRPNEYGRTPLSAAVMRGNEEEFRALLAAGATADIRKDGNTLLHEAAMSRNSSSKIVRLLVEECGQDPNALNGNGQAPLHLAAHSSTPDMFNMLVQLPSTLLDIRSRGTERHTAEQNPIRQTPLHILAAGKRRPAADMAQSLLKPSNGKTPADPCATDVYGRTPLEIATPTGSEKMVRLLLHHTPLGHKSVKRAYAACKSDTIKALFEERTDIKPSPYCDTGELPHSYEYNREGSSSDSEDTDGDDPIIYVHTSELFAE